MELLETFQDYSQDILQLLKAAKPGSIHSWSQNDAPKLETWTQGRLALIGDAAHPFLPCK